VLSSATMNDLDKAKMHRMRAVMCNQRASQATDLQVKRDWEELAIEWHHLASQYESTGDDDGEIEVAYPLTSAEVCLLFRSGRAEEEGARAASRLN